VRWSIAVARGLPFLRLTDDPAGTALRLSMRNRLANIAAVQTATHFHPRKYGGACTVHEAGPITPDGKTRFRRMPAIADKSDNFAICAPCAKHAGHCTLRQYPPAHDEQDDRLKSIPGGVCQPTRFQGASAGLPRLSDACSLRGQWNGGVVAAGYGVPGRMSFLEKGIHHVLNAYLEGSLADKALQTKPRATKNYDELGSN